MSIDLLNDIYGYRELNVDKLKHEYEIIVSSKHIIETIDSELKKIAQNVKLPGFRTGKAPYELIVSNYKSEATERALNHVIEYCSDDLIKKNKIEHHIYPKIKIISLPDLSSKDGTGNLVYQLSFESMPEVPLIDLDKINLKIFKVQVEENDVREFIDSIRERSQHFISVDDALYQAKNGDRLIIDFEGRIRGKIFKGGNNKNYTLDLGSDKFIINGFGDQLIGLKKWDTKTFKLRVPENYEISSMAGQEADFFVRINDIKSPGNFESNDDLAKSIGFTDSTRLTEYAEKTITFNCQTMLNLLTKRQVFDYLDAQYSFDLPAGVVKEEQKRIRVNEEQESKVEGEAERRVKLAMLLMKFGTEHKLEITDTDITEAVLNYYRETENAGNLEEMYKFLRKSKGFQQFIKGQALENKVTNYIIERVNKDYQSISVKELRELFDNTFKKAIDLMEK